MHRKKLTAEQKIQIVKLYFEEKESKTEIAERYGVDQGILMSAAALFFSTAFGVEMV